MYQFVINKTSLLLLSYALLLSSFAAFGDEAERKKFRSAMNAINTGKSSIDILLVPAEDGNAEAQYYLGLVYYNGRGKVPLNLTAAFHWTKKAADQGHVWGQYQLARMYYYGDGVPKDLLGAVKILKTLAERGEGTARGAAALAVGVAYRDGSGDPRLKDPIRAYEWFLKAKSLGREISDDELNLMRDSAEAATKKAEIEEKAAVEAATKNAEIERKAAAEAAAEKAESEREAAAEAARVTAERSAAQKNQLPGPSVLSRIVSDDSGNSPKLLTNPPRDRVHLEAESIVRRSIGPRIAHCRGGDVIKTFRPQCLCPDPTIVQARYNFGFEIKPIPIVEADRLNGIVWRGFVILFKMGGPFRMRWTNSWRLWEQEETRAIAKTVVPAGALLTLKDDGAWEVGASLYPPSKPQSQPLTDLALSQALQLDSAPLCIE